MRRVLHIVVSAFAVLGLAVMVGCGGDDGGGQEQVDLTQGRDLTVTVITHDDGSSFWGVAKKGALQAGKDMGVTVKWSGSNNDPQKQAQLIDAAVTEKVDALAVSAPDPEAITEPVKKAVEAGIPVISMNSGVEAFPDLGAITHVGQTESLAGEAAGRRLKQAGVTKLLCVIHEQGNVALNDRCAGTKKGFGSGVEELQVKGTADIATTLTEIQSKLESDDSVDGVLTLNPDVAMAARDAIQGASSEAKLATFDLSGDVVKGIQNGEIDFAIDQQQYLQGYLPVVFLALFKENANTVGGGQPVLTGPGFVDKGNADTVAKLAEEGTR